MSQFFDALSEAHCAFIAEQPMFFVATAAVDARINLSPKGLDSFRVIDANTVAYVDFGGSGNETQGHLEADGRITVMFCAFENPPLILRLYGHGRAVLPQDDGFDDLLAVFPRLPGVRQVFVITIESVQTSCGWGVPRMSFERPREALVKFHAQQDPDKRLAKLATRTNSIDGLPLRVQAFIPPA